MIPTMKPYLLAALLVAMPLAATAQDTPAAALLPAADSVDPAEAANHPGDEAANEAEPQGLRIVQAVDVDPDDFLWEWRIVAVMADTPNDPAFIRQMREIGERPDDLFERDVVVIVDANRNSGSILRQRLRPRGFMLAIIDKDGEVKQRRPSPRDVREISAVIDRFPLRRQEILERLPAGR